MVKVSKDKGISSLFWADDILLLSKTKQGLQKKLNVLNIYSKKNNLLISTDKTESMIFNRSGRLMTEIFFLDKKMDRKINCLNAMSLSQGPKLNTKTMYLSSHLISSDLSLSLYIYIIPKMRVREGTAGHRPPPGPVAESHPTQRD